MNHLGQVSNASAELPAIPVHRGQAPDRSSTRREADPAPAARMAPRATSRGGRRAGGLADDPDAVVAGPLRDAVRSHRPVDSFAGGFDWHDIVNSPGRPGERQRGRGARPGLFWDYGNLRMLPERGRSTLRRPWVIWWVAGGEPAAQRTLLWLAKY